MFNDWYISIVMEPTVVVTELEMKLLPMPLNIIKEVASPGDSHTSITYISGNGPNETFMIDLFPLLNYIYKNGRLGRSTIITISK